MQRSCIRGAKKSESTVEANGFAARWHGIAYFVAILPFVLMLALAWLNPDSKSYIADWKLPLVNADLAWQKGDFAEARHLYLRSARFASWGRHWQGLVAAACGLERLDSVTGFYFTTHNTLVRAMIAAEQHRSPQGLTAVADIFASLGRHEAAAMVLAKIEPHWAEPGDSLEGLLQRCRSPIPQQGQSRQTSRSAALR